MTAPLQYLLITVNVVAFEKVCFSDKQNPKTVNAFTVDDKFYLLNRDNLTQPVQMQFYQKQKTFSEFFYSISKIYMKL